MQFTLRLPSRYALRRLDASSFGLRLFPVSDQPDLTRAGFGRKLKSLREARGLSQIDLSRRTGFHQTTISSWERGTGCPDVVELLRLARALQAHPQDLIDANVIDIENLPKTVADQAWRHVRALAEILRRARKPGSKSRRGKETDASP